MADAKAAETDESTKTKSKAVDDRFEDRIRTLSVSCPVHPALDEIIQELEEKLQLKREFYEENKSLSS